MYIEVIGILDWELSGNPLADTLVQIVQFESIRRQYQFIPLWEGLFFDEIHERVLEKRAIGEWGHG